MNFTSPLAALTVLMASATLAESDRAIATVVSDGCKMEVELPKEPKAGTPVRVRVTITNTSKVPVAVRWNTRQALPFYLEIETGGKPVPLTRYGVKKIAPTDPLEQMTLNMGSIQGRTLGPGETKESDCPNLALYYDLTLPGDYDLTVSRYVTIGKGQASKKVWLRAKAIRLTIAAP